MADQPDPEFRRAPRLPQSEAGAEDRLAEQAPAASAESDVPARTLSAQRRLWLTRLALGIGAIAIIWLAYHFLIGVRHVTTDNAYVGADTAQVTPLVSGAVASVRVMNTQMVKAGDILITIDPADARLVADRAQADLALAQSKFREGSATGGALSAQIAARDSDIARARAELVVADAQYDKARIDLSRRQDLAKSGAVSGDELTQAQTVFAAARAQQIVAKAAIALGQATRTAAQRQFAANQEVIGGVMRDNPDVASARARLGAAKLDLDRTTIRAPFDGLVAQRNVQIGQRVAAGTPVMTIVPLDRMYVDANFKESQLRTVRIGQAATLTSDLYGGGVIYHGRIVGLAGGTGAAFAIIPAQNATGNWIKVVQRLPVRIALDPAELRRHPLRVGLSMDASIDVAD